MYFAQEIRSRMEKSLVGDYSVRVYRIWTFYVKIDNDNRAVWGLHDQGDDGRACGFYNTVKSFRNRRYPLFKTLAIGKRVTGSEAARLTGVAAPPALDYLVENANPDPDDVQNYRPPPRPRKAKLPPEPSRVGARGEVLNVKLRKARERAEEWRRRVAHAQKKAKEWDRKAARMSRRLAKLLESTNQGE
jgi:hypothetical protein